MQILRDNQDGVERFNHYINKNYNIDNEADLNHEILHNDEARRLEFSFSKELDVCSWKYLILVIKSLAKTIFSLGLWLIDPKLRDDWSTIWNRKKVRQIYSSPNDPIAPDLLQNCASRIKKLAPDENNSIDYTFENLNYNIWWDTYYHRIIIDEQMDANFIGDRLINKLSIQPEDKHYLFYQNENRIKEPANRHLKLINGVIGEIYKATRTKPQDNFNECLQLLESFLYQNAQKLDLNSDDENIKVWLRTSKPNNFINFQSQDPDETLEIKLYYTGGIESASVNGVLVENGLSYEWNRKLTNAINSFLDTQAVRKFLYQIQVHPLGLSQRPETVLNSICENGYFPDHFLYSYNIKVQYLNNNLEEVEGLDHGGPKRQFISDLIRNLLDGSKNRVIQISSNIPMLSNNKADKIKQVEILRSLGSMMSACSKSDEFAIGRVLPDNYFGLLKAILNLDNPKLQLSNDEIIRLSEHIWDNEDLHWVLEIYKNPRELSQQEIACLNLLGEELPKGDIRTWVIDFFNESLQPLINKVGAAHSIAQGMIRNDNNIKNKINNLSVEDLSKRIQGEPFSREDIAKLIKYNGNNPVVAQKTKWLQEFILDEKNISEEWIKQLLKTITGMPVVVSGTIINIASHDGKFCKAHTCSKQIDIPDRHISPDKNEAVSYNPLENEGKKWFKLNLELTMANDDFGIR